VLFAAVMIIDALSRRHLVRKRVVDQRRWLGIVGARKHQGDQQQAAATTSDECR